MTNRMLLALLGATLALGGCDRQNQGPLQVSAIGGEATLVNPNIQPLDAVSSTLLLSTAQGLVRFDAAGQIEPGLAQSWIVSDDGLRYTFRLRRTSWNGGDRVTAAQVVERLRAASSRTSRNPLTPLLGAIDEMVAMTDDVLEISLVTPRPNFLQLLAQPEMAILRDGNGTGPYRAAPAGGGAISLYLPDADEGGEEDVGTRDVLLRGERTQFAVARFMAEEADLVTGGDIGGLPIARAAEPGRTALRFDPAPGLFGFSFAGEAAATRDPAVRRALSMAVDREELVQAIGAAGLIARDTLVSPGVTELAQPALPNWSGQPIVQRRTGAAVAIRTATGGNPLRLTAGVPDTPGHRLVFAHLRRDWRAIGVIVERVSPDDPKADLRFVDRVAAIDLATWYLRQFSCDQSRICNLSVDAILGNARLASSAEQRQALLAEADRLLTADTVFIPLANPVRWSLVSPRLTGFAPNPFGHHNVGELIAPRQ